MLSSRALTAHLYSIERLYTSLQSVFSRVREGTPDSNESTRFASFSSCVVSLEDLAEGDEPGS